MDLLAKDLDIERLRLAYELALNSDDPSTQNGALAYNAAGLLIGQAANALTYGTEPSAERYSPPLKEFYVEHAERGALYDVLRKGLGPVHTLVCPWAACADCARAIVQSGVHRVVRHVPATTKATSIKWLRSILIGDSIMISGGVEVVAYRGVLGGCAPVRFAGELWKP